METQTFTIEVSEADLQIILKSLVHQPYISVANLIAKLHSQIEQSQKQT